MQLEFEIENQIISRTDNEKIIINESANYIDCKFTFLSEEWENMDKYALFKNEKGKAFCVELGSTCTKTVKIPYEVLIHDFFRVTVFGLGENYRITTNECTVLMKRSGFTEEIYSPVEYNGDIFSQLMGMISNCLVDVKVEANHLLFYKNDTVYFSFEITNHTHSSSQIPGLEDTIGVEIKRGYRLLSNKIRTYGE